MWSGTIFGQGNPCEKQGDQLCILLQHQLGQEGVERRKDHVPQFDDKKIEVWHGRQSQYVRGDST